MNDSDLFTDEEWKELAACLGLTHRQAEVVHQILAGRNDRQIASKLGISLPTVRAHLQRVFESQGVTDRTTLVIEIFKSFRTARGCGKHNCNDEDSMKDDL